MKQGSPGPASAWLVHVLREAGFGLPCLMALESDDPPSPPYLALSSYFRSWGGGPRKL